jgi:16S rRNA (adenine1518-N6/adenine1519-N6)-dimethyltransferase
LRLERERPRLRKELGQHHLRHPQLCGSAVDFLAPAQRRVLEIGPGGGVLTAELLAAGARVVGWELDLEWAMTLRQRFSGAALEIVVGDALEIPWSHLHPHDLVAGNLPYGVATPIIEGFLSRAVAVERAAFLVQAEVAQRLAASPGSRTYGYLSVLAGARARISILGRVKASSFQPPPKVDGAFVGLERRPPPLPEEHMSEFLLSVSAAFRHRRKTLANALRSSWERQLVERVLEESGLDGRRRAETLALEELVALHEARMRLVH